MRNLLKIFLCGLVLLSLLSLAVADEKDKGAAIYQNYCAPCHATGMAGAPIVGDKEAWAPLLWQGMDVLIKHSIDGYRGNRGEMPARGGFSKLSDDDVVAAVDYMAAKSR